MSAYRKDISKLRALHESVLVPRPDTMQILDHTRKLILSRTKWLAVIALDVAILNAPGQTVTMEIEPPEHTDQTVEWFSIIPDTLPLVPPEAPNQDSSINLDLPRR